MEDCSTPFTHIYYYGRSGYISLPVDCHVSNHILKRQNPADPREPVIYFYNRDTPSFRTDMQDWNRRCNLMRAYFKNAPLMPDPLPDAPERLGLDHMLGPLDEETYNGMRNAITRSLKLRQEFRAIRTFCTSMMSDAVKEYLNGIIDMSVTVGHHVVDDLCELIERAAMHTVDVIYPYFVVYFIRRDPSDVRAVLNKYAESSDITRFDIPTILHSMYPTLWRDVKIMQYVPLQSTVSATNGTWVSLDTDVDGIDDMLERDGWTPEHVAFARDQIMAERAVLSRVFRDFLATREDRPETIGIQ